MYSFFYLSYVPRDSVSEIKFIIIINVTYSGHLLFSIGRKSRILLTIKRRDEVESGE